MKTHIKTHMKTHSINPWKKLLSGLTVMILASSIAHATKYRPPVVDEDESAEVVSDEDPAVPSKSVKVIKNDPSVTLTVPKPQSNPDPEDASPGSKPSVPKPTAPVKARNECIRTLKEYNAPENAHIKEAVGGSAIFATWYDQNLPVSIRILPQGGAVVNAPGQDSKPRPVALCVDKSGSPILKFDGHSIRLRRGPLRNIAFKFENYNLSFTTRGSGDSSPASNTNRVAM